MDCDLSCTFGVVIGTIAVILITSCGLSAWALYRWRKW